MSGPWIDKPGGTKAEHWIDLISQDTVIGSSDDHWEEAAVKWDGCIHYLKFSNFPGPETEEAKKDGQLVEYLHICDIDEFIESLRALRAKAIEHFGEKWPEP